MIGLGTGEATGGHGGDVRVLVGTGHSGDGDKERDRWRGE
jgi:hypothetical protein